MYIPIGAAESKAPSYAKEETMAAQTRGLPSLINHYCVSGIVACATSHYERLS